MRYVAAYCLAMLGGNHNPTPADITKIMASVGIDCDAENAKKVIESLKGKNLEEVIAAGLYTDFMLSFFNFVFI
jgi:large subunit ribosomal protein LP2